MSVIFIALPVTLALAGFFVVCFVWSARKGQFEDLETPAMRVLFDDDDASVEPTPHNPSSAHTPTSRSRRSG